MGSRCDQQGRYKAREQTANEGIISPPTSKPKVHIYVDFLHIYVPLKTRRYPYSSNYGPRSLCPPHRPPLGPPRSRQQVSDPTVIRYGLEAVAAAIRGAGCAYGFFPIGPDDVLARDALVAQLREKKYDGVIIGFGVRGTPELTGFFEEAVNAIKEALPTARLLFNSSPPSTLDAVKRNFPL